METDLAGALLGYCTDKKIIALTADGKSVFDFAGYLEPLKNLIYLSDLPDIKVGNTVSALQEKKLQASLDAAEPEPAEKTGVKKAAAKKAAPAVRKKPGPKPKAKVTKVTDPDLDYVDDYVPENPLVRSRGRYKGADDLHGIPEKPIKFDWGKLGALVRAGKDADFLTVEFGISRAELDQRLMELPGHLPAKKEVQ